LGLIMNDHPAHQHTCWDCKRLHLSSVVQFRRLAESVMIRLSNIMLFGVALDCNKLLKSFAWFSVAANNVWITIGFTYDTRRQKYCLINVDHTDGLCLACMAPLKPCISAFCCECKAPRSGSSSRDLARPFNASLYLLLLSMRWLAPLFLSSSASPCGIVDSVESDATVLLGLIMNDHPAHQHTCWDCKRLHLSSVVQLAEFV